MKKQLLIAALLTGACFTTNAQNTIFEENWDGTGPGIAGWTMIDGDGKTPNEDPLSSLVTDAWNVVSLEQIRTALDQPTFNYPAGATGMAANVALTNSWYEPVGVANDWLITPAINIPAGGTASLTWSAASLGAAAYLEDYEVNISTTVNNSMAAFTQLLDVPNELSSGSARTVNLDAYAGETVYIAFRNKGNDQYTMVLDNVKVTSSATAGVNEQISSQFSVSPNPATNVINITNAQNMLVTGVSIVDINGRTVKNAGFNNVAQAQINISDLASGVYMMNITSDHGTATKKIVKN